MEAESITMATKKKTKKKAADDEARGTQIAIRLSPEDYDRLKKNAAVLPLAVVARVAIRLGLDIIERQPGVLLGETPKKR